MGSKGPGKGAASTLRRLPSNATRAAFPRPAQETRAWKVTSVQHNVVNHVAFVFGVIEAERTAKIFGALLGDRRMPGFHVHGKSRSGREAGREAMSVTKEHLTHTPCQQPYYRDTPPGGHNYGGSSCLLTTSALVPRAITKHCHAVVTSFWKFCYLAGLRQGYV